MNQPLFFMTSISAKVALLGLMVWLQLYLLRRAPASARNRLCALSFLAVLFLAAGEVLMPGWMLKGPAITITTNATAQAAASHTPKPAFSWVTLVWTAGFLFMLVRAVVGRFALSGLRRRSTMQEQVSGIDVGIADVQTPLLCGVLRPSILLPRSAGEWTSQQKRMVLTHEVTHYRHGDHWINLLAQGVRAALWFHPVAWWLASRLSREQELACDEAVVGTGVSAHDYAAFLLESVRNLNSQEMFCCAMAGSGARSLKQRFANLLDTRPRPKVSRRLAATIVLFGAIAATLTVVRPVWSQNESEKDKVYMAGGDVLPPKVLHIIHPDYTDEAKAAKVEGSVILATVITAEGKASDTHVVQGIGSGLDEKAVEALEKWEFQPGTRNGQAVAVRAKVEVNFKLK